MARFILDIATEYDDKGKITTDIKEGMELIANEYLTKQFNGGVASITCIEEHNTGQFYTHEYKNKLTKKQVKVFNENPHG
jgi:hypothetical protein